MITFINIYLGLVLYGALLGRPFAILADKYAEIPVSKYAPVRLFWGTVGLILLLFALIGMFGAKINPFYKNPHRKNKDEC